MSTNIEKRVYLTLKCDSCGAIQDFEMLPERESNSDIQLVCSECGWNIARITFMEANKDG